MKKIKNKIRKYIFSPMLIFPFMASAQFDVDQVYIDSELPDGKITDIVTNVMLWILGLVGIIGVIGFAIAGILYLTAAGDDSRMELGKNAMKWSIIGIIVALMGFVIIQAVNTMLGGTNAEF